MSFFFLSEASILRKKKKEMNSLDLNVKSNALQPFLLLNPYKYMFFSLYVSSNQHKHIPQSRTKASPKLVSPHTNTHNLHQTQNTISLISFTYSYSSKLLTNQSIWPGFRLTRLWLGEWSETLWTIVCRQWKWQWPITLTSKSTMAMNFSLL